MQGVLSNPVIGIPYQNLMRGEQDGKTIQIVALYTIPE